MKRIIVIIALLVAAGCGTESTSSNSPTTVVEQPTTTTTTEVPKVTTTVERTPVETTISDLPEVIGGFEKPLNISIPSIGVEANIQSVGNLPNGEMFVPEVDQVGWWKYGAAINQIGSMVLAGHVDYNGVKGVFYELRNVQTGDQITVNGTNYVVTNTVQQDKSVIVDSGLFDNQATHQLAIVTCGGSFDQSARSYEDNIIVYAEIIG